ncbi:MAG: hypothetical protein NC041_09575 [Bacteroides sp.]|nr:hypothetical protein [Prevotella sp.]MCM1408626.1 hypothetical protein [Treponema brennaborense]MCM1470700.1 hypothetical protein [Bacteroides sp.]
MTHIQGEFCLLVNCGMAVIEACLLGRNGRAAAETAKFVPAFHDRQSEHSKTFPALYGKESE